MSLLQSATDHFFELTVDLKLNKIFNRKYVQLFLFFLNFAKDKQEKPKFGVNDFNSCAKLRNSVGFTRRNWIKRVITTSALYTFEKTTPSFHYHSLIQTSCSASKRSMFIEGETEGILVY